MKKILVILAMLISAASLHGMDSTSLCELERTGKEVKKPSSMTLSQLYYYFSHDVFVADVAQHIFSLQCGNVDPAKTSDELKQSSTDPERFVRYVERLITSCGEMLASEICEYFFKHAQILICDIKNKRRETSLHSSYNPKVAQILINAAGVNVWELLTMQDIVSWTALHSAAYKNCIEIVELVLNTADNNAYRLLIMQTYAGWTVLHCAAFNNCIEIVKLLLNAAGDDAQALIMIQNYSKKTVLDMFSVNQETKQILQSYITNNKVI